MNERSKSVIIKLALASIPFVLLLGAWTWNRQSEAGGPSRAARPPATATTHSAQATTSAPKELPSPIATENARQTAEKVALIYLSNPSPTVREALQKLKPLVSPALYERISGEWEGSNTLARPYVESLRSATVTPSRDVGGMNYTAEAVQIIVFPAGPNQNRTLSVYVRLKPENGRLIAYDLSAT